MRCVSQFTDESKPAQCTDGNAGRQEEIQNHLKPLLLPAKMESQGPAWPPTWNKHNIEWNDGKEKIKEDCPGTVLCPRLWARERCIHQVASIKQQVEVQGNNGSSICSTGSCWGDTPPEVQGFLEPLGSLASSSYPQVLYLYLTNCRPF